MAVIRCEVIDVSYRTFTSLASTSSSIWPSSASQLAAADPWGLSANTGNPNRALRVATLLAERSGNTEARCALERVEATIGTQKGMFAVAFTVLGSLRIDSPSRGLCPEMIHPCREPIYDSAMLSGDEERTGQRFAGLWVNTAY